MAIIKWGGELKRAALRDNTPGGGCLWRWKGRVACSDGKHWQELRLLLEVILL